MRSSHRPVRPSLRALRRDCRGVTAIEFALVAPTFFLVLYAMVELGWALLCYNQLGHAVYEAARYAIVHGADSSDPADNAAVSDRVVAAAPHLGDAGITVTTTWDPDNEPGSVVTVTATYAYEPLLDLFGWGSFDLASSNEMVIAR